MMKPKINAAFSRSGAFDLKDEIRKHFDSSTNQNKIANQPEIIPPITPARRTGSRNILQLTKLSRLPSLPKRTRLFDDPPPLASTRPAAVCVKCRVELTADNQKTRANVCTKCLSDHAIIEIEIDRAANEKANAVRLEKMFGGQI